MRISESPPASPLSSAATQTASSPTATSTGPPSTSIVSVTSTVSGSTREIVPSREFATQTEPCPTATPDAPAPTGVVSVTEPVPGSMRETVSSSWLETQTAAFADGDVLRCERQPNRRRELPGRGVDTPQPVIERIADHPHVAVRDGTLEKYASEPSSAGGATKSGFSSFAVTTSSLLTRLSAPPTQTVPASCSDCCRSLEEAAAGADDVLLSPCRPIDHRDVGVLRPVHHERPRVGDREVGRLAVRGRLQRHGVGVRIDTPDRAVAAVRDPDTRGRHGRRRSARCRPGSCPSRCWSWDRCGRGAQCSSERDPVRRGSARARAARPRPRRSRRPRRRAASDVAVPVRCRGRSGRPRRTPGTSRSDRPGLSRALSS